MKHPRILVCTLLIAVSSVSTAQAQSQLQPWQSNPWYWSFEGDPILLLGGSDDDNLFQWPPDKLIAQLDRLSDSGGNVIRNTMSDRNDKGFEVYPFKKLDTGKYDLEQWNDTYWNRFERMLAETAKRKIFVQIEIWDRFDFTDNRDSNRWQKHPYNPANNVNYTYEDSGFAKRYPDHPGSNRQPFFFTTPKQRNNKIVLNYQQQYVAKLLEHTLAFDHVLYCMDNETNGEEEWSRYWANFVLSRAAERGKIINITEMWDDWNLSADRHRRTFDHPELYGFVDVSQNNHNKGQNHWDNFLTVRKLLAKQPRPMNTTKTYGASGNKFGHSDQDGIERFWRHLLAGAASMRFHRPDSGLGLNAKAVASIQAARKLEDLIPLWTVNPANHLLSQRKPNEAYVASSENAYVIYFPAGGEVMLDAAANGSKFMVHWINIDSGQATKRHEVESTNSRLRLSPPSKGNWVAAILASPAS